MKDTNIIPSDQASQPKKFKPPLTPLSSPEHKLRLTKPAPVVHLAPKVKRVSELTITNSFFGIVPESPLRIFQFHEELKLIFDKPASHSFSPVDEFQIYFKAKSDVSPPYVNRMRFTDTALNLYIIFLYNRARNCVTFAKPFVLSDIQAVKYAIGMLTSMAQSFEIAFRRLQDHVFRDNTPFKYDFVNVVRRIKEGVMTLNIIEPTNYKAAREEVFLKTVNAMMGSEMNLVDALNYYQESRRRLFQAYPWDVPITNAKMLAIIWTYNVTFQEANLDIAFNKIEVEKSMLAVTKVFLFYKRDVRQVAETFKSLRKAPSCFMVFIDQQITKLKSCNTRDFFIEFFPFIFKDNDWTQRLVHKEEASHHVVQVDLKDMTPWVLWNFFNKIYTTSKVLREDFKFSTNELILTVEFIQLTMIDPLFSDLARVVLEFCFPGLLELMIRRIGAE